VKICIYYSIDALLRKYIDLLFDTFCEAGTSLLCVYFWNKEQKPHIDYLKFVRPLNWCCIFMKERMPFKKSVRMSICDILLMICLLDFRATLNKNSFEKRLHIHEFLENWTVKFIHFLERKLKFTHNFLFRKRFWWNSDYKIWMWWRRAILSSLEFNTVEAVLFTWGYKRNLSVYSAFIPTLMQHSRGETGPLLLSICEFLIILVVQIIKYILCLNQFLFVFSVTFIRFAKTVKCRRRPRNQMRFPRTSAQ